MKALIFNAPHKDREKIAARVDQEFETKHLTFEGLVIFYREPGRECDSLEAGDDAFFMQAYLKRKGWSLQNDPRKANSGSAYFYGMAFEVPSVPPDDLDVFVNQTGAVKTAMMPGLLFAYWGHGRPGAVKIRKLAEDTFMWPMAAVM